MIQILGEKVLLMSGCEQSPSSPFTITFRMDAVNEHIQPSNQ